MILLKRINAGVQWCDVLLAHSATCDDHSIVLLLHHYAHKPHLDYAVLRLPYALDLDNQLAEEDAAMEPAGQGGKR